MLKRNSLIMCFISMFICLVSVSCNQKKTDLEMKKLTGPIRLNQVVFAQTANEINMEHEQLISALDEKIRTITLQENATFGNTVTALDGVIYRYNKVISPHYLLWNVSPDSAVRDAGMESSVAAEKWENELWFREDLYAAVKGYADKKEKLMGEKARLLERFLRKFERNGFALTPEQRDEIKESKNRISDISAEFSNNKKNFSHMVAYTKEELKDLSDTALSTLKKDDLGNYLQDARLYSHYAAIVKFSKDEQIRHRAHVAFRSVAGKKNPPLLAEIIRQRAMIARIMGYQNFADYSIEVKMAGTGDTAISFLEDLADGVEPKFRAEQESLRELKADETGNPDAVLNYWDGLYYERQLFDKKYKLDKEAMRDYFSMEYCLAGMFDIYQRIFGIAIMKHDPPENYVWYQGVDYYQVTDTKTGELLGAFYLDLYPREGKYSHFAEFELAGARVLEDGTVERPVCALICNFPKPTEDIPSLLPFDDVSTLFHEFGHAMHVLLSKTEFAYFHGTNVPRDFVEAPSQMLELWLKDKQVLDLFAKHYKTGETVPEDFLTKLESADKAVIARGTRGQIAYGMIDLTLHTKYSEHDFIDMVGISNDILGQYWMDYGDDTAFIGGFTHLAGGYAAGYYGYKWSEAISYDLAAPFRNSPDGFLDETIGMKLRREIYEPGDSRDIDVSIEAFLGRKWNSNAYFDYLGI